MAIIPIHDFSKDDHHSVPFNIIPLHQRSDYDTTSPHRHNYFEIFLFEKGGGHHNIDFGQHAIHDGSIHFVAPGMVHKVERGRDSMGTILLFSRDFYHLSSKADLSLYHFPFLQAHIVGSPVMNLPSGQFEELYKISELMAKEKSQKNGQNTEIIRTFLHVFLLKCQQFQKEQQHPNASLMAEYQQLLHLIELNFRTYHQPSYYVEKLGLGTKKTNQICQINAGMNLGDTIKNRLMLEAKRLLIHSDYSIKQIAYFLGFDDPSYFNRFFRKAENISAGQYRKGNGPMEEDYPTA